MTQRQRRRKEVALEGKSPIIARINEKIAEFKKYAKESGRDESIDHQEHLMFLQTKKAKHEKEAEILKTRLAGG